MSAGIQEILISYLTEELGYDLMGGQELGKDPFRNHPQETKIYGNKAITTE